MQKRRERYIGSVAHTDGLRPHKTHAKFLLSGGMLICPNCGGNFEARKNPWKPSPKTLAMLPPHARQGHSGHVYICSTRRRKPDHCTNTLALPIDATDDAVLSQVIEDVLSPKFIRELMRLVDTAPDDTEWLLQQRDQTQKEVDRLVASIAAGVPAEAVAEAIRAKQSELRKLDARLRAPRRAKGGASGRTTSGAARAARTCGTADLVG